MSKDKSQKTVVDQTPTTTPTTPDNTTDIDYQSVYDGLSAHRKAQINASIKALITVAKMSHDDAFDAVMSECDEIVSAGGQSRNSYDNRLALILVDRINRNVSMATDNTFDYQLAYGVQSPQTIKNQLTKLIDKALHADGGLRSAMVDALTSLINVNDAGKEIAKINEMLNKNHDSFKTWLKSAKKADVYKVIE